MTYNDLMSLDNSGEKVNNSDVCEQVETQAKYQGYIERQLDEIERQSENELLKLPKSLNYAEVRGLSTEVRQKLDKYKPETLGQASRISGMTPAAISLLLVHLKRGGATMTSKHLN